MRKFFYIFIYFIFSIINADDTESMNYIIDNIYLGDRYAAADEDNLKKFNISNVVNCAGELTSNYTDLKFIELGMGDYEGEPIFPKFDVAYKYIKKHTKNNLLIHCSAGMSRSASLVIFYIMKEKGWDYETCFNYTKERRSVISLNPSYIKQLSEYYDTYIKK